MRAQVVIRGELDRLLEAAGEGATVVIGSRALRAPDVRIEATSGGS